MNGGQPSTRNPSRSRFALSRFVLLVLIGLCILFVTSYSDRLRQLSQVVAQADYWEQEIAAAKQRNAKLQAELEDIGSPRSIDELARGDLGLAIPGDTVIVVVEATPVPPVLAVPAAVAFESAPNVETSRQPAQTIRPVWKQWIDLLAVHE